MSEKNVQNVSGVLVSNVDGSPQIGGEGCTFDNRKYYGTKQPMTNDDICKRVETLSNELKEKMQKKALDKAEETAPFVRDKLPKLSIAPLEVTTKERDWTQFERYDHRDNVAHALSERPTGNITHFELFKKAHERAEEVAKQQSISDEAKQVQITRNGNFVGVIGHAGIGKTTFTKSLVKKVLPPNKNVFGIEYVFYICFRDINYEKPMNLLQFLTNDCCIWELENEKCIEAFLLDLNKNERVLIVMDGLDEAALTDMKKNFTDKCSVMKEQKAETFIKNILNGHILLKAKKLITSRPQQMYELHEAYKPVFMVNVLGLSKESQEKICGEIVGDKDRKEKILQFLRNNPDLDSYCYVPVNCILVVYCINTNLDEISVDQVQMDSLTTIMVNVLGLFVKEHTKKNGEQLAFQIENLCKMAYEKFSCNQLYFDEQDLQDADIDDINRSSFFTVGIVGSGQNKCNVMLMEGRKRFYFSHLILQELCVALYIKLYMKDFGKLKEDLKESKYQMVTKLLFGLSSPTTKVLLEALHLCACKKKLELPDEAERSRKVQLKKLAQGLIRDLCRIETKKCVFNNFQICSWLYEMRDEDFTTDVVSSEVLQNKLVITGEILPSDVPSFYYMLRFRKKPLHLSVVAPNFVEEALEKFFTDMGRSFAANTNNRLEKLKFKSDNIGDDGAEYIAMRLDIIDELHLVACPITEKGLGSLSRAIKSKKPALKKLDLCSIKINDTGAGHLQGCLQKINRVKLQLCHLSEKGIEALTAGIKARRTPITELNLSEGDISENGAEHLASCVFNIKELKLKFCKITATGAGSLANAIAKNAKAGTSKLKHLDLSENIIYGEGATHLASCVANIDELVLEYCYIDAKGASDLAEAIKKRAGKSRMTYLCLLNNKIGDEGLLAMSKCLSKIKKLSIGDSNDMNLSLNGIAALANELKSFSSKVPMEELSVCCRRSFEEKAKKTLEQCRHAVQSIVFQNAPLEETK